MKVEYTLQLAATSYYVVFVALTYAEVPQ